MHPLPAVLLSHAVSPMLQLGLGFYLSFPVVPAHLTRFFEHLLLNMTIVIL